MNRYFLCLCTLLASLLFASSAEAVVIKHQDRAVMVRTLLLLDDGKDLGVDTPHMDKAIIERDPVNTMRATHLLHVERFKGRGTHGTLVIEQQSGDDTRRLTPPPFAIFKQNPGVTSGVNWELQSAIDGPRYAPRQDTGVLMAGLPMI